MVCEAWRQGFPVRQHLRGPVGQGINLSLLSHFLSLGMYRILNWPDMSPPGFLIQRRGYWLSFHSIRNMKGKQSSDKIIWQENG